MAISALRYTPAGVAAGLRDGLPLALSVLPWGLAFGIAARPLVSMLQGLVMSAYVYSGTAQFIALGMWQHPLPIASLLAAVFAINARYLLQGLTLAPWLSPLPRRQRWGTLFFLADAGWATSLRRFESGYDDIGHLLGTGLATYTGWIASTWAGLLLPVPATQTHAWGLDFAVAAALIALAGGRWAGRSSVFPWTVAVVAALMSQHLLPEAWSDSGSMFMGGIAGAIAGALRDGRGSQA